MKRYFLIAAMVLVSLASCKKPIEPEGPVYPVPEKGVAYQLEGTVSTEGFAWRTNSIVGLYSAMDEIKIINKECKIVGWAMTDPVLDEEGNNTNIYTPSEYEGKAVGKFDTPQLDLVQGENKFMVYSPYNSELSFNKGVIYGLEIGDQQSQNAPNVAADCFSFGYATGIPGVDEAFQFELNPVTAMAQISLSTATLGKFAPKKVTIYDDTNTPMAGGFNIDVNTMELTPVGQGLDRVSVEVIAHADFETVANQNLYVQILPNDYAGKELWVVVELVDAAGARLTIPTKKADLKFEAGKVTKIDLTGLSTEMNAAGSWYNATETRLLPAKGVAYGDANTYLIQCKNGSTYKGATYTPNANIPDEVTIDYRARGNFYNAEAPEGVTFEWATLANGTLYTSRLAGYEASGVVIKDNYTITHNEAAKTVTVKNTGAYAGAPILLMKKGDKVLWAWTFWNIAADGTTLDPVTVGDYKFAPMDIGQPTTNAAKWIANKAGSNPDVMFRMTHFYQWGRPMPFFWTLYWTVDNVVNGIAGNVAALKSPLTFEESLANPVGFIINVDNIILDDTGKKDTDVKDNKEDANWCTEAYFDLWGSNDAKKDGAKSIYDPCPKGWKVAPTPAIEQLVAQGHSFNTATAGDVHAAVGNLKIHLSGRAQAKIGTTDLRLATMGGANSGNASGCKHGAVWANAAGQNQGQCLFMDHSSNTFKKSSMNRSHGMPVRCVVDTDNR